MCDVCGEFLELLQTYEEKVLKESSDRPGLKKEDVEVVSVYLQTWPQRQCMCGFRDPKNFDRFNLILQSIICLSVIQLREIKSTGECKNEDEDKKILEVAENSKTDDEEENEDEPSTSGTDLAETLDNQDDESEKPEEKIAVVVKKSKKIDDTWSLEERETLLNLLSKVFLINFPLYIAYKHSVHSKLDDITQQEAGNLSTFCDLHDIEVPIYLLRNVCLFCKSGGMFAMTDCFEEGSSLPVSLAQAIIAIVCNLKLWLNYRSVIQLFVPLRSRVLRYLCNLSDKDLRLPGIKTMADFMWGSVKDPLDAPLTFDRDGLDLAFKYFTSSTLTMRLAGIAHINSHINMFNELCNNETVADVESVGQSLANWLVENNIISHIFGPNLHVEVIKQSHIILSFLAMEGKVSNEHVDVMWQAAQLKHCSKQVHDLLPPLIKHLEAGPVMHLYELLCKLETKDQTEQSLFLASNLIKFIWSSNGAGGVYGIPGDSQFVGSLSKVTGLAVLESRRHAVSGANTSSENSVSMDGSNSEEEEEDQQEDSSQHSEAHKTPSSASEGPTPCKHPRKRAPLVPCDESSDDMEGKSKEGLHSRDKDRISVSQPTSRPTSRRGTHGAKESESPPSDVEADGEKSGAEELLDKSKRKRLRRRKRPMKMRPVCGDSELIGVRIQECVRDMSSDDDIPCISIREVSSPEKEKSKDQKHGDNVSHLVLRRGDLEYIQMLEDQSLGSSRDSPQGGVMTELASLVQDTEYVTPHSVRACRPYLTGFQSRRELMEDMSGEEGSYSSRMSTKSEKNMADFDGEESGCEEELVQLAAQGHHLGPLPAAFQSRFHTARSASLLDASRVFAQFNVESVCKPGNTLLWDLLQDDKISQLGEGLALEAEKALCSLLCYSTERLIRMKFIEGCLENLSNNRSVVISLRMLPKLFGSFQQFRGMDTHQVTIWAEQEHNMMAHFFSNLCSYVAEGPRNPLHSHQTEVQVRLQFLTSIFSSGGSPESFRLSLEQVDTLWQCLASDGQCSDELARWFLDQARSTGGQGPPEHHALGLDALRHLYLRKLPSLQPEHISMVALNLFQQLCNLARMAAAHPHSPLRGVDAVGMDHLWRIALRASSTDVSMSAIQYLNGFYVGRQLEQESEFVSQCMAHLAAASAALAASEEPILLCIQRALLLLRTHLDTFRRRYAYHLRRWALEGQGVGSHIALIAERTPVRVQIQPAGITDKVTLDLQACDFVADLRAEVAQWWETMQAKINPLPSNPSSPQPTPVLGSLLSEGPIRMITQGQELTTDFDEKTLQEMGFKDQQLVFISMGASRPPKKRDSLDTPSVLPPPPRESLPTILLLQPQYFEQLFGLMHTLSAMKTTDRLGHQIPHTKAQVLSRRVWDILTLLPTSPTLFQGFLSLADGPGEQSSLPKLLDPASPQKLMYSLYIVESLSRNSVKRYPTKKCDEKESKSTEKYSPTWSHQFVKHGGLRHLFDIFMSGVLQRSSGGDGSEWQQDCLATLLKLLCQLGMASNSSCEDADPSEGDGSSPQESGRRKPRRNGGRAGSLGDRLIIHRLSDAMLQMMDVGAVMPRLTSILYEASLPRDPNHYKTGFWGRAQVVHYAMALLVSWVHSSESVREALFTAPNFSTWLQRLVLEDPEPSVRREVCTALYRLCLGSVRASPGQQQDGHVPSFIAAPMLAHLLEYLPIAEGMRSQRVETLQHQAEEGKEPYGPACRDFFWLLCRLVDSLNEDLIKESIEDPQGCVVDIDSLAKRVSSSTVAREYLETRHNTLEDEGLIGLLSLMTNVLKHNPPFKTSKEGQEFLLQVFEFLFALPNPRKRYVPKCKSHTARSAAYDLLVELVKRAPDNYRLLHEKLLSQHQPNQQPSYPWDYWPHEDGRSDCGYVGLTNLGATCYMASCMQHLYMMPQARSSILQAKCDGTSKHEYTLKELQRMFAYLLESERKAYNPRSFCKVYQMDHQPLNTGEQKDMAEFFIDLVSKLEEMTPELKRLVKMLFCGVISNNVVSLDCPHVSRTQEEFYTVRCQVADMRNLYESLDEVTVKDTLEGDNMYTCSQCGKKVRAEKRACFKKLPHILCFNTMRYTFNMVTMLKEKVNTHFSFPLRLDMSGYVEKHLMPQHYQEEKRKSQQRRSEQVKECVEEQGSTSEDAAQGETSSEGQESSCTDSEDFNESYEYDLIGVTVHTGTADGGHYYSFIRDRTTINKDKWFLFNDAEVKPFDPNQIASECFGGEMTSKTYDSVTDKFLDFSFEKTNSAYMLFYEWSSSSGEQRGTAEGVAVRTEEQQEQGSTKASTPTFSQLTPSPTFELSKELEDWIWRDNMHFLRDKNIFEHTYFNFMWQICGYIPQTLLSLQPDVTEMAAQLSASFFLETFIHAKEKPTMVQWVELLSKQFNASQAACEWFLSHMASNEWWPMQILIKCPNQMVRQMFHRICIHVIQLLRGQNHSSLYLKIESDDEKDEELEVKKLVSECCVTRFIRMMLSLMEHGAKAYLKHLTEYFAFLYDFSKLGEKLGEAEAHFLLKVEAISAMVNFYLGQKAQEYGEVMSEEDEEEDVVALPTDKYKPASLDKMVLLIAVLVEKSRGEDQHVHLSGKDLSSVAGGKGFPFLYQQIKDAINLAQTRNLIYSLCRWNERLAIHIVNMIFQAITKHSEVCQPFFKLLTLMTEVSGGPSGLPCFTQLALQRVWEVAELCPQSALEWLTVQVPRNKLANTWVLQSLDTWVEHYLMSHGNQRVRSAAANLLVALVPSPNFRQVYRLPRAITSPNKELLMGPEAVHILHQIYSLLLCLLKPARHYTDTQIHGTTKLTAYFALLTYCAVSRVEKLMFGQYFLDLWQLFHPKLSEPSIAVHHNKQALLMFWNHVTVDCPENVALILQNGHVTKNIAFNYILADHDEQEVVMFNRQMLPSYYGLLRACCQQSRTFTRQLAGHQNIHWAFKNITPYPSPYPDAVDELFKLMHLFVLKYPDSTEQEIHDITIFRRQTLQLYLQALEGRTSWATLITAFRTLIESEEDRLFVVYNGGLQMMFDAFYTLHMMYHEATACHVSGDMLELLTLLLECLKSLRLLRENKDGRALMLNVKDWPESIRRLATLLNTYNPSELRVLCMDLLKEILLLLPAEGLHLLVPLLSHCHAAFQESHNALPMGPYFPRRGHKMPQTLKSNARPQRPMVQMAVPHSQLEASRGVDDQYDQALQDFYSPYHQFIDVMCRLAINSDCMSEALVNLSAMVGFEGVPLHLTLFPKLWLDIHHAQVHVDRKLISMLSSCSYFVDYVEAVLLDERNSLNILLIYNFLFIFFPKVATLVLNDQTCTLIENLVASLANVAGSVNLRTIAFRLNGDLRALALAYSSDVPLAVPPTLLPTLEHLLARTSAAVEPSPSQPMPGTSTADNDPSVQGTTTPPLQSTSPSSTDTPPAVASVPSSTVLTDKISLPSTSASTASTSSAASSAEASLPSEVASTSANTSLSMGPKTSGESRDEVPSKKRKTFEEEDAEKNDETPNKAVASTSAAPDTSSCDSKETSSGAEDTPPSTSQSSVDVTKPTTSTSSISPPQPFSMNWLEVLEKTIIELKEIIEKKVGGGPIDLDEPEIETSEISEKTAQ